MIKLIIYPKPFNIELQDKQRHQALVIYFFYKRALDMRW